MTDIVRISKSELEGIALAAARVAVQELQTSFMSTLGINIADSEDVKTFQANIRFAENLRIGSNKIGARLAMTTMTVLAGAIAIAAWEWTKTILSGIFHWGHG